MQDRDAKKPEGTNNTLQNPVATGLQSHVIIENYQPEQKPINPYTIITQKEKPANPYTIILDAKESVIQEIALLPPIENLAFKGGGVKGAAYVGALQQIDETIGLNTIKRVSGASAGAITATMVALGLNSEEIRKISSDISLSSLVEAVPAAGMKSVVLYNSLNKELNDDQLDSGNRLLAACKKIIRDRVESVIKLHPTLLGKLNINLDCIKFKDLKMIAKLCPQANFKDLTVSAVKLTKDENGSYQDEVVYFGTESEESNEMEVALAVRMSASIPYFFKAINYQGHFYIDGGCLDNFPISVFDSEKYQPLNIVKSTNSYGSNLCTLGLRVDSSFEVKNALYRRNNIIDKQTSYGELVSGKLKDFATNTKKTESTNLSNHDLYNKYSHNTIQLDDLHVDAVDFGISDKKLNELISTNRDITINWFNLYRDEESVMTNNKYAYKNDMGEAITTLCQQLTRSELTKFIILLEKKTPGLIISKEALQNLDAYYKKFTVIAKQVVINKNDGYFSKLIERLEDIILEVTQSSKINDTSINLITRMTSLFTAPDISADKTVLLEYLKNTLGFAVKNINNLSMRDDEKIKTVFKMLNAALSNDSPYHYLLNSMCTEFKINKKDAISPYYEIRYQMNLQFERIQKERDDMHNDLDFIGAQSKQNKLDKIKYKFNMAIQYINNHSKNGNSLSEREKAIILLKYVIPAFDAHTINKKHKSVSTSSGKVIKIAEKHQIYMHDVKKFQLTGIVKTCETETAKTCGLMFFSGIKIDDNYIESINSQFDVVQGDEKQNEIMKYLNEQIKNLQQILGNLTIKSKSNNQNYPLQLLCESFEMAVKKIQKGNANHDDIMKLISEISEIKQQCKNYPASVINTMNGIQEKLETLYNNKMSSNNIK